MKLCFLLSNKAARETIISELKQSLEEGVEINCRNGSLQKQGTPVLKSIFST